MYWWTMRSPFSSIWGLSGLSVWPGAALPIAPVADLPVDPVLRFHAEYSSVTLDGNDRVTSASDLMGTQNADLPSGEEGPLQVIDLAGNKQWRFDGGQILNLGTGFSGASQSLTVFAVGRNLTGVSASSNNIFSLGSREAGTQANSNGPALATRVVFGEGRTLQCGNKFSFATTENEEYFAVGAQKQVIATSAGSTGCFMLVNDKRTSGLAAPYSVSTTGAEIGRYSNSATEYGTFFLYELVVFDRQLTTTEADAVSAALMGAHNITTFTNQFITEGDSISQGTSGTFGNDSPIVILSEPGRGLIPADWRVANQAKSGDKISSMIARSAENGWFTSDDRKLSGRNVLAYEIGRNDWSTRPAADEVADMVSYLNAPATGLLQRGWEIRPMVNIGTGAGAETVVQNQRTLMTAPQFLVDLDAELGGTYDGKVTIVPTYIIENDLDGQIFFTFPPNPDYIAGDNTHPNQIGAEIRLTGGSTPEYGIAFGLV